uniref:Uncharacterized protein n=1 Tax=Rhizophora mucronata TaxID=61149 RepID=A0A2P2MVC7_RHIMU
MHKRNSFLD